MNKTLQKKQNKVESVMPIIQYINNLSIESCIFNIKASSPTFARGEALINRNGEYSFLVEAELSLTYFEGDGTYDFAYRLTKLSLVKIFDKEGFVIPFTKWQKIPLDNILSHKIIFNIIKNF